MNLVFFTPVSIQISQNRMRRCGENSSKGLRLKSCSDFLETRFPVQNVCSIRMNTESQYNSNYYCLCRYDEYTDVVGESSGYDVHLHPTKTIQRLHTSVYYYTLCDWLPSHALLNYSLSCALCSNG